MTWPLVILGALGINVSSFSSRIQVATTFEDSLPCSGVSKRPKRADDAVTGLDQVVAGKALHAFALRQLLRNAGAPNLP